MNPANILKKKDRKRQKFTNPIEFLLSCISMSVGLGNIWRFPFVAVKNGGGLYNYYKIIGDF